MPAVRRAVPALAIALILAACAHATPSASRTGDPASSAPPTTPAISAPPCTPPPKVDMPSWVPGDLPFPTGTYAVKAMADVAGFHEVQLYIPGALTDLATFILNQWPPAGYVLGHGDAESSELDQSFSKGKAAGTLKSQAAFCTPGVYSNGFLIYTPDRSKLPQPGASPSESDSPSP